ncbi:c-type cytochrome [Paraburkholderia caribensis]|uniref:c-type cytochrome n=2 Tax=Paraburkholderia caribensis TaxID=75105 RepID=UPI0031DDD2DB
MDTLNLRGPHPNTDSFFSVMARVCATLTLCAFASTCFAQNRVPAADGMPAAQTPKPAVVAVPGSSAAVLSAGEQLAELGAPGVPACFSCHGAGGRGNGAHFPAIAGQPVAYTIARIHAFQARAKESGAKPGTMKAVASALDEQQIHQVAAYLSVTKR